MPDCHKRPGFRDWRLFVRFSHWIKSCFTIFCAIVNGFYDCSERLRSVVIWKTSLNAVNSIDLWILNHSQKYFIYGKVLFDGHSSDQLMQSDPKHPKSTLLCEQEAGIRIMLGTKDSQCPRMVFIMMKMTTMMMVMIKRMVGNGWWWWWRLGLCEAQAPRGG